MNIPTKLSDIQHTPMADLIDLPAESLAMIMDDVKSMKAKADNAKSFLDNVLNEKYKTLVLQKLGENAEPFGTVRIDEGDIQLVVTTPKKADWCDLSLDKISKVLSEEWNEDPSEYIKTKKTVNENAYKNWPSTIQKLFQPARTVMAGKTSYKFERMN